MIHTLSTHDVCCSVSPPFLRRRRRRRFCFSLSNCLGWGMPHRTSTILLFLSLLLQSKTWFIASKMEEDSQIFADVLYGRSLAWRADSLLPPPSTSPALLLLQFRASANVWKESVKSGLRLGHTLTVFKTLRANG